MSEDFESFPVSELNLADDTIDLLDYNYIVFKNQSTNFVFDGWKSVGNLKKETLNCNPEYKDNILAILENMREYKSNYIFLTFSDPDVEAYLDIVKIREILNKQFEDIPVDTTDSRVVILEKEGINALVIDFTIWGMKIDERFN